MTEPYIMPTFHTKRKRAMRKKQNEAEKEAEEKAVKAFNKEKIEEADRRASIFGEINLDKSWERRWSDAMPENNLIHGVYLDKQSNDKGKKSKRKSKRKSKLRKSKSKRKSRRKLRMT